MPGILMGLRTINDPVTKGERAFILGSITYALENGETPVKVKNFVNTEGQQ